MPPARQKIARTKCLRWVRNHFSIPFIFIFHFSFFIFQSCGLDVEDPTPPSPPIWAEKSLLEEWPERGIDAQVDGIMLEWENRPNNEDVAEYHIFKAMENNSSETLSDFSMYMKVIPTNDSLQHAVDVETISNVTYHYAIRSNNESGNISSFSDTIYYTRMPSVKFASMAPNGTHSYLPSNRQLKWKYDDFLVMEDYCLTILTNDGILVSRNVFTPTGYLGSFESWTVPDSIILESGKIYKWRVELGAQYNEGVETAGSESQWASFQYVD